MSESGLRVRMPAFGTSRRDTGPPELLHGEADLVHNTKIHRRQPSLRGHCPRAYVPVLHALLLLLAACSTDYRPASVNPGTGAQLHADLAACNEQAILNDEVKASAIGFIAGAFAGAAQGALAGAIHGGSAEGAAIGAVAGATLGFVVGLAAGDDDVESCMAARGWSSS